MSRLNAIIKLVEAAESVPNDIMGVGVGVGVGVGGGGGGRAII